MTLADTLAALAKLPTLDADSPTYSQASLDAFADALESSGAAYLLIEADSPAKNGVPRGIVRVLDADETRIFGALARLGLVARDPATGVRASTPAGALLAAYF